MKQPRKMRSSEGRHQAIEYAPRLSELMLEYKKLNSREARVAFIDTWLKIWAYDFEKTWPVIYQALEWVEQDELYKDPRAMSPDEIYPDFKSFFEARLKKPFTMWMELEQTHHYVSKFAPELIDKTFNEAQTARAKHANKVNVAAPDLLRHGGDRRSPQIRDEKNVTNLKRSTDDESYAHGRLRKDRPDIHQRVLDGELTAHAGMVEAGFRKKRDRRKMTLVERLWKLWKKATKGERTEFRAKIDG